MSETSKQQGVLSLLKSSQGPDVPERDVAAAKAISEAHGVPVRPVGKLESKAEAEAEAKLRRDLLAMPEVAAVGPTVERDPVGIHPIMQAAIEPFTRQPHTASAGPQTSQDAGDEHTDSGKRLTNAMRVLRTVYRRQGQPASNLAHGVDLTLTEVRRRLTDLQALNYVEKGERRGREFTWRITTAGLLALSRVEGPLAR